jgi:predicted branched-subunit amino acid permease
LRFIIYSGALRPSFKDLSAFRRIRLAVIISDMGFAFYMQREAQWRLHPDRERYFLWLGVIVYAVWNLASILGILAATLIPSSWGINVGGTLVLVALLVPLIRSRPEAVGAFVSALVSLACHELPLKLGTLLAILMGIVAALLLDRWDRVHHRG